MKVFHGNAEKEFQIQAWKKSRYGFPALFFATELKLAELFAIHHANKSNVIAVFDFNEIQKIEPKFHLKTIA